MNTGDNIPKKPENRPGLPKIAYRISDYAGFRRRLLSLLPSILPPSDPSDNPLKLGPLAKLTTRLDEDPAIALLDAWAVVAEVLTFYQERIANEGYLRTATERRSVLELARAIGYELKPGVAASTFLTFTVEDAPGSPKIATIPKGTQIMSVPGKDELPQTFETSEEFTARVDWNVIKPRSSRPQKITSNTRQLYLNGISTQLKAGDYLLLVDEDREISTYLLSLTDVKEDAQAGYTLVKWEEYLNPPENPLRNPKVFAFRQKANLFGYNAPAWEDMSAEVKLAAIEAAKDVSIQWGVFNSLDNGIKWQSASKGLPDEDIICLAAKKGIIFAGTPSKGVFRSKDNGNTWEPANNGLTNLNIKSLYINQEHDNSPIFAGTPGGGVFRSKDNGDTWVPINIGSIKIKQVNHQINQDSPPNLVSVNTSLPNTIVRSVLTYDDDIIIGTDDGVFLSANQGKDWEAKNLSSRTVYSLLIDPDCILGTAKIKKSSQATITVSDTKLSRSPRVDDVITVGEQVRKIVEVSGEDTNPSFKLDRKFDPPVPDGTTVYLGWSLLAGTDRGVYYSPDLGDIWYELNNVGGNTTALALKTVYSLVNYRSSETENCIFAGTNEGIYRSLNCGKNWEFINNNIVSESSVYSLITYEDARNRYLFAATNKGIFFSTNSNASDGVNWTLVGQNLSIQNFTALALEISETKKQIFAGSKFSGFISSAKADITDKTQTMTRGEKIEWPSFQITDPKLIDLDTLYPQVLKNSWFVLFDDRNSQSPEKRATPGVSQFCTFIFKRTEETFVIWLLLGVILQNWDNRDNRATPRFFASRVENISTISRRDFGLNGKITRIESNLLIKNAEYFGLQSTIALIRSEELELAKEQLTVSDRQQEIFLDPIQGKTILLNYFIQELQNNQTLIVSGKPISIQLDDVGGVFHATNNVINLKPMQWKKVNQGLTNSQVTALTKTSIKTIAGTTEGILYSSDNDNYWEPFVSWWQTNQKLQKKKIQALLSCDSSNEKDVIFVGTAEGIYRSQNSGDKWEEINQGLTYKDIRAIAFNSKNNTLFIGTANGGVFQSQNYGKNWTTTRLTGTDVQALAVNKDMDKLIAGTVRDGVFYSTDNGNTWQQFTEIRQGRGTISSNGKQVTWIGSKFNQQLKPGDIINVGDQSRTVIDIIDTNPDSSPVTFTVDEPFRPDLLPGTAFTINTGLTNRNITAVATGAKNVEKTVSINGKSVTSNEIIFTELFKIGDTITITITNHSNSTIAEYTRVIQSITNTILSVNEDFLNEPTTATSFIVNIDLLFAGTSGSGVFRSKDNGKHWEQININLTDLEIRCLTVDANQNVWVGTARGGVFRSDNQGELWQPVNTNLTNIDVRSILIKDLQLNTIPIIWLLLLEYNCIAGILFLRKFHTVLVGGVGILKSFDSFNSKPMQRRDMLQLLEPPLLKDSQTQWTLMDKDGFQGYLTTISSQEITLLPAAEDSEFVSEVVKIQSPPIDQQMPVLTLQEPLKNAYDPTTVKIYGNVVEATHGETIEEVLGSGDGNLLNQRFALKKNPLTYVSTKSASGADSTLEVRVNGIRWQEVPSLYSLTAQNQSYIIRIEDDGTTTVTFGDGIQGSRLPTGEENITATYRSGIGLNGNVGADRLSLLKTRPFGITEVTNPVPATGAAAPESLEEARTKAPFTVRTLDRIVSLPDFGDFVRGFAGIGKAQAVELWHEGTHLVHITIAAVNGAEVLQDSNLYTNLIEAIDLARDPLQKVQVDSYERLLFNLEARLILDRRYQAEAIEPKVRAALNSTFAFEQRQFGQAVTTSEVVAVIQNIQGVVAVDLDALYQVHCSKALEQYLMALPARSEPQTDRVRPAQLLLLNTAGIKLTRVSNL